MTKMIYGHMPPFMTEAEHAPAVYEPSDEELSTMQKAKEDFKAKCNAVHEAVTDMVNNPGHYTFGNIECIDYIKDVLTKEEFIGYLRGCMIKYQHRLHNKGNSAENAGKMKWYNDRLIKELEQ